MTRAYEIPKGYETRMRILKSVNQLLQETSVEALSVVDICSAVPISRQTFYRYFEDKYDAINWYHRIDAEKSLAEIGRTLTWYEGVLNSLRYVFEEQEFYKKTLHSNRDYSSLVNYSMRCNAEDWRKTITEYNNYELTRELELELQLWVRTGAQIVADWVKDGFKYTPEEFARILDGCRPQNLQRIMDDPVLEKRKRQSAR